MFLAQAFKIQSRVSTAAINLLDIAGLQLWLKRDTDVNKTGAGVFLWQDLTTNSNDASQTRDANKPAYTSGGKITFDGVNDTMTLNSEINLGAFTICIAMNPDETGTLTNDAPLGRAGNDIIKMYRAGDDERIALKANGVQSEINPMSQAFPTSQFLLTCIRNAAGLFTVRINGTEVGGVATTITDLFDVTQIGSGDIANTQFSGNLNEFAIWNVELTGSDLTNAESDIISRNAI